MNQLCVCFCSIHWFVEWLLILLSKNVRFTKLIIAAAAIVNAIEISYVFALCKFFDYLKIDVSKTFMSDFQKICF